MRSQGTVGAHSLVLSFLAVVESCLVVAEFFRAVFHNCDNHHHHHFSKEMIETSSSCQSCGMKFPEVWCGSSQQGSLSRMDQDKNTQMDTSGVEAGRCGNWRDEKAGVSFINVS